MVKMIFSSWLIKKGNSDKKIRRVFCCGPYVPSGHPYNPAGASKFQYVVDSIVESGFDVEVISFYLPARAESFHRINISDRLEILYLFPQLEFKFLTDRSLFNHLSRRLARIIANLRTFFFFLYRVKKNDVVVAYHDPKWLRWLLRAHRFNRFRLILETEEIYSDVFDYPKRKLNRFRKREFQIFNAADAYIFSTVGLNRVVNLNNAPHVIINGVYKLNPVNAKKFSEQDGKIHLVYAGILSQAKGVGTATTATKFLSEKYHMHILGFGSRKDIRQIRLLVEELSKASKCSISFDGLLTGDEFTNFLQACDVGMSTQNADATFNSTSFPSKVLTYLTNGLCVVSVRIPAVEESEIGDLIHYYDGNNPQDVAKAIQNLPESEPLMIETRLKELDLKFKREIKLLINSQLNRSK